MQLLYVVHGYKPAFRIGGPIESVASTAEFLVRKGHQVIVFTTNSNLDEDLDVPLNQPVAVNGVEVWYFERQSPIKRWLPFLPAAKSFGYLYSPEMAEKLDEIVPRVDLVHTQMPFMYPTLAASRAARRHRKPLFYHQRGTFDPERLKLRSVKKRLYIACFERAIMQNATTVFALTKAEEASYRAIGVETHCEVVPNGVDAAKYSGAASSEVWGKWDFPSDSPVILFLGRLHPIKGADTLLQAFLKIRGEFPKAILVMAGPDEWGLERRFKEVICRAGASASVKFPGMVSGADKLGLLSRADIFCLPSAAEGFSMAVLEALASRVPVILSPGCYFPEVVECGAGWISQPTPEAFSVSLRAALQEPSKLPVMGELGRKLVMESYNWDGITDQLVEAYREGIDRFQKSQQS